MPAGPLRIRLFGALALSEGEDPLPSLDSARAESLLAYLVLHREAAVARQRLAAQLWPGSTEQQARTNLRHVLHTLRRALPDADRMLDVTPRTLQWRPDAPCWVDVVAFDELLGRDDPRAAVELYTGDLLESSHDEWLAEDRERLRWRYLDALGALAERAEVDGELDAAAEYGQRLLRHDPLREQTYQLLIRVYDARGDRARALRAYHACATALDRELGVAPSDSTRQAYERLLPKRPPRPEPAGEPRPGTPLVGRAGQRTRLAALWAATVAGRAQLVLITGEPGVGKSRLVEGFRSWCAHRGATTAAARSYPAEGVLTYAPIVSWLRAQSLWPRVLRLDRTRLAELTRLLPELSNEVAGLAQRLPLPEREQRPLLFDALAAALTGAGRPLLLVADDIQWWDAESLQFLHYLLRSAPLARCLVAATCRAEDLDDNPQLSELRTALLVDERVVEVPLDRLSRKETAELAERLTGNRFGAADLDRLFAETEGSPLFIVEAVRAGWRGGPAPPLSAKVNAVIDARLARLSEPAIDVVRVAATIGREFGTDVLAAAGPSADRLVRGLDELWRRGIIRDQGADAYDFSHDKIREVAYRALSPAHRARLHLDVAAALQRLPGGEADGQIAAHYEAAGRVPDAVRWSGRAAATAQRLGASATAIRQLGHALDLLATMPDGRERLAIELDTRAAMLPPLAVVHGYATGPLTDAHDRCLAIAESLGIAPPPPVLRSLAVSLIAASRFAEAQHYGEQLRAAGEHEHDDVLVVEGEYVLGIAAFWQAHFDHARTHFTAAVDRYRPEHRAVHLARYVLDPHVVCLSRLGNTWWFLGKPHAAVRARDAALAMAARIDHPPSLGTALVFGAMLAVDMRDWDQTRELVAALNRIRARQLRPGQVSTAALNAFVEVLDGKPAAGIAHLRDVLDAPDFDEHAPGLHASVARLLVGACELAGDPRAGLAAADRALGLGGAIRVWAPEIRRQRARFAAELDLVTGGKRPGNAAR